MRISTNMIYDLGVGGMQRRQADLIKTQQQLSSGKRVLTPADDPVAAARVLDVAQSQQLNKQYMRNADAAQSSLNVQDSVMGSVTQLIQDVKTLTVNAGDGALSPSDLTTLATEVQGHYQALIGLANSRDNNGDYLFAGFQGGTRPFGEVAPGTVAYFGDQGNRQVQISPSRQIPISDPGPDIFQRIKNGNGTFATAAAPANTGTGVITPGSVVNSAALTGDSYAINFTVASGATTYNVVDTTTSATVLAGASYLPGNSITVAGMQMEISGAPASGDSFTVQPSANVSLFKTLSDLVSALRTATSGSTGNAKLTNALSAANQNLDNTLGQVGSVRASVGSRLKEIVTTNSLGQDLDTQFQGTLSQLQDVDYAKAASDLSLQQVGLQAAQQSFIKVTQLSLFSLLR